VEVAKKFQVSTKAKALKSCVYLPPYGLVLRWLGAPSHATMLKNQCRKSGAEMPPVSPNTLNKMLNILPTQVSVKAQNKVLNWADEQYPDLFDELQSSKHLAEEGVIAYGSESWLGVLPKLKREFGERTPYLLQVIDRLICEEKRCITEVLSSTNDPVQRFRMLFENNAVEILYQGVPLELSTKPNTGLIANVDGKTASYLIAIPFLHLLAAADAEYSQDNKFIDPLHGLMQVVLPYHYKPSALHRSFWERIRDHACTAPGEKAKWSHLERHVSGGDEDSRKRTLNRYKSGAVRLTDEGLKSIVQSIWGGDSADQLVEVFYLRYKAVVFLSNMFDSLFEKNSADDMKFDDIDFLIGKYKQLYKYHYSALSMKAKG